MPKLRQAQTSFYAGQLSALLAARYDKPEIFRNGAEVLKNVAPLAQGGVRTRPGTRYLATLAYAPALLVPFVFNPGQRSVFAFSNGRADIYDPAGAVVASLTGAPWTSAMMTDGKFAWTQYGDTMIVCHPDMKMQVIKRTGASAFTRSDLAFEEHSSGQPRYQPYYKYAAPSVTITPSATTGSITVTASAAAFAAAQVNDIIRYKKKEILVTAFTSATQISGTVREALPAATADADWDEPVFSAYRGYAVCPEFFDDRLVLFGAKSRPSGIWLSKVGAYFNFDLGTALDTEAIWEGIASPRISEARFAVGGRHLLLFADRALFYVPTSTANPLTPKNFAVVEQAPYGAARVRPLVFDGAVAFVQSTGAVAREALWSDTDQAYAANPISLFDPSLVSNPTAMTVLYGAKGRPEQYLILLNGDGALSVFHSVRDQRIAGWAPWTTAGTVKSICAADEDVFVAVERALAAGTVWALEVFDDAINALDCSKKATSGTPTKTFSGFSYLAGRSVQVSSKGHPLGTYTVDGAGTIALDALAPEVTEIEAGFAFEQRIRPMPAVFDLPDGPTKGLVVGLTRAMVQIDRSAAFTVDGDEVLLKFAGDDFANPPPTATGIVEVRKLGYDPHGQVDIVINDPVKVTILGLTREVMVNG